MTGQKHMLWILCCIAGQLLPQALVNQHSATLTALGLCRTQIDRVLGLTLRIKHVANGQDGNRPNQRISGFQSQS